MISQVGSPRYSRHLEAEGSVLETILLSCGEETGIGEVGTWGYPLGWCRGDTGQGRAL